MTTWKITPDVHALSISREGVPASQPDWRIHGAVTYPEVFYRVHHAGVLWTYQFEPDEPISKAHHHGYGSKKPNEVLPFTPLELAIKELVMHDNVEPLATYLSELSPSRQRSLVRRLA